MMHRIEIVLITHSKGLPVCNEMASFLVAYSSTPLLFDRQDKLRDVSYNTTFILLVANRIYFILPDKKLSHAPGVLNSATCLPLLPLSLLHPALPRNGKLEGEHAKHQLSLSFAMKTGSTKLWKACKERPHYLSLGCRLEGTARHVSVSRKLSAQKLSGNSV